jgi:hypothetical protein
MSYSRGTPNAYLCSSRERKEDNWNIRFSAIVCYYPDCSSCYSEVVEPEELYIVIPGLSLHDPKLQKPTKNSKRRENVSQQSERCRNI